MKVNEVIRVYSALLELASSPPKPVHLPRSKTTTVHRSMSHHRSQVAVVLAGCRCRRLGGGSRSLMAMTLVVVRAMQTSWYGPTWVARLIESMEIMLGVKTRYETRVRATSSTLT